MLKQKFFEELGAKVNEIIASSPAADIEKNVKALMASGFNKLDLVTREEFDVQTQVLARTREQLTVLEKRIAELEQKQAPAVSAEAAAADPAAVDAAAGI